MGPHWTFESRITNPDGITVATTITVPVGTRWGDEREASEIGQMGANWTLGHVLKSIARTEIQEECPF